jgi:hypothetical protein
MCIPVKEPADVLGLVASDLAVEEAGLGALRTFCSARAHTPPLIETVGLQEPPQRRVGRHRLEIGLGLGKRDEIVVVQLRAPAFVRGILSQDRLAHGAAHRRLLAGVSAQFAPENPNRIPLLPQGAVIPALESGKAEENRLPGRRVAPGALRQGGNGAGELTLGRGCSQQLPNDGKAKARPPFVHSSSFRLIAHVARLSQKAR